MRSIYLLVPLASLVVFSGCAAIHGYPQQRVDIEKELQWLEKYYTDKVTEIYINKPDAAARRAYRDEVVNGRIRVIDIYFIEFEKSLSAERTKLDIGAEVTNLALTGTSAVLPGFSVAQTVLPAVAAFISGTKLSIDKKAYFDKSIPILFAKMESLRKQVLVRIRSKLTLEDDQYTLYEALGDVDDYYKAGTLPAAFTSIAEEAGVSAKKADQELKEITTYNYFSDENGRKIRRFWKPKGEADTNRETEINNLIKKYVTVQPPPSITDFIKGEEFRDARCKVVEELGL